MYLQYHICPADAVESRVGQVLVSVHVSHLPSSADAGFVSGYRSRCPKTGTSAAPVRPRDETGGLTNTLDNSRAKQQVAGHTCRTLNATQLIKV